MEIEIKNEYEVKIVVPSAEIIRDLTVHLNSNMLTNKIEEKLVK